MLEQYYGVPLLNRRPYTSLTPYGEIVLKFAQETVSKNDELIIKLNATKFLRNSKLKIGIQEDRSSAYITPVIAEIQRVLSKTKLYIFHNNSLQLEEQVRENKIDFAFTINSQDSRGLHIEKVADKKLYLMATNLFAKKNLNIFKHKGQQANIVNINDISNVPLVVINKSREAEIIRKAFEKQQLKFNPKITVNSGIIALDIIRSGNIAMIAPKIPNKSYKNLQLFEIRCNKGSLSEEIDLIYAKKNSTVTNLISHILVTAQKYI